MKKEIVSALVIVSLTTNSTAIVSAAGWSTGSEVVPNNQQTTISNSINLINNYRQSSYFNDISGHWAQTYIEQWAANGIFGGMGDGTFRPNDTLTREQFASVLLQLFDFQMVSEENSRDYKVPSDVNSSSWAREAIAKCLDNGIMNLRNGFFAPDQPITREEVFFALGTAMNLTSINKGSGDSLNKFIDSSYVSSAAKNVINRMVSLGMIHGKGNNKLEPQAYITRGEVSTILSQSIQYLAETSIKKETFENAVVLNVSSKRGDLTVSDVKVNGNLFITGNDISTLDLESISVSEKIYIYADSIEEINLDDVTDTDFIIICPEVTFEDSNDSDGNTFIFINPVTLEFNGEADEIEINGDYIEDITINGNAGDKINSLVIHGDSSDAIDITLSGYIEEAEINADAIVKGYGRVKTLIFDEGDYESEIAGDTTKVLSGKLTVNGSTYSKGTYYRTDLYGANTPDENIDSNSNTNINTGIYVSPSNLTHSTGSVFNTKIYYASNKTVSYLTMDNASVGSSNYSVDYSDNSILLKSEYIDSLNVGYHTLKLIYADNNYSIVKININYNSNNSIVTPINIYHAKGSIFTTTLTYQSAYNPTTLFLDGTSIPVSYSNFDYVNRRISINSSYINSLSYGEHNLRVNFSDGSYSEIKLTISDDSSATSFNYDKIAGSTYHHDIVVNGITTYPTSVYFNSSQIPTSYYKYNAELQELTFVTAYLDTFEVGTYTVNINTQYGSKTITIKVSKSSQNYNFLDNMGNIDKHTNDIIFSTTLDHFTICTSIESIQFMFDNEVLIDAIFTLSKWEQDIIFNKFLLDMTDIQIASMYNVSRQIITRDRLRALKKLRVFLEDHRIKKKI